MFYHSADLIISASQYSRPSSQKPNARWPWICFESRFVDGAGCKALCSYINMFVFSPGVFWRKKRNIVSA